MWACRLETLRPTAYPYEHLERLIGVDLMDYPEDPSVGCRLHQAAFEMLSEGVITESMAARIEVVLLHSGGPTIETEEDS